MGFAMRKSGFRLVNGLLVVCALACLVRADAAHAQGRDNPNADADVGAAAHGGEGGMLLPFTISPRTDTQRAVVRALGGYDSARRSTQFEAVGDVTVIGPLALRVGAMYTQKPDNNFRPTVGARVQALSQERFGVDLGVGLFYRPEGFTEAEGEIELAISVGRRFGRLATYANLIYGQDPEAAERDGELRLGALYAVTSALQAGLDSRLRFDLGSEEGKRKAEGGAEYDVIVGPTASYALGPVAAIAHAGLSVFGVSPARAGVVALLGVAGAI